MQDRDGQTMMTMPFSDGAPGPAVRVNPRDMRRIILAQSKRANVGQSLRATEGNHKDGIEGATGLHHAINRR